MQDLIVANWLTVRHNEIGACGGGTFGRRPGGDDFINSLRLVLGVIIDADAIRGFCAFLLDLDLDRSRFLSFLGDFLRSFLEDLEDFFSSLSAFRFVPAIGIGWWGGRLGWGWVGGWGWGWGRGWGLQFYIYLWWSPNGMKKLHKKISAS